MNKAEALRIASEKIAELRRRTYERLCQLLEKENVETAEIKGQDGVTYQVAVQAMWDDGRKGGNLRVRVAVDDGGWRAILPLCKDFIIAPDGSSVGE